MVLKRLKLHHIFNGVARTFSYTQAWVSEGGRNLKILATKAVFLFSSGKNKFDHFCPPLEKLLEKSTSVPPVKNPSDAQAHKYVKLPHFCKDTCVVFHHPATLFNNTNAVTKPYQGNKLCMVYSAKQLRNHPKL